ncbi:MAG: hypothetical protein AB7R89_12245 [Dehalococcoidia bacterium]
MTVDNGQTIAADQQPMTVNEASDRYPGQWILMRVLETDEYDEPVSGLIVTTGPTRDSIQDAVMEHVVRRRDGHYFVFSDLKRISSRREWEEIMERAMERERYGRRKRR